jgi:hypothetical protein
VVVAGAGGGADVTVVDCPFCSLPLLVIAGAGDSDFSDLSPSLWKSQKRCQDTQQA